MMNSLVAKRYAKALFEVANSKGLLDQVEENLKLISKVFNETEGFLSFLRHPLVEGEKKKQIIDNAFGESIDLITKNFLFQLVDSGREEYLEGVLQEYIKLANEVRGIADVTAITAVQLARTEREEIEHSLQRKFGKTIRLHNIVDPTIVGGMIIRIGDRLYDGSLKKKLHEIKRSLVASRV
ncbi:F0F1 ATP synthase subunit delta [Tepidibacillus infernus]|uniref:F0F1 ATP synthase subunit delta n=1 Tax=Tepidibacillus TaxID=1494427 RepID=UPI0008530364|nr:F0F1 ATP synthase subunit delta [Tepidibacillus sp. HK-1]GBF11814.1 ATP synthase subunit delta [Tepidibacillus sp. HK-1]